MKAISKVAKDGILEANKDFDTAVEHALKQPVAAPPPGPAAGPFGVETKKEPANQVV